MKLSTEWWGIILKPENRKDSDVLVYLAENISNAGEGRRSLDIYEEGTVEIKMDNPPSDNLVQSLEINR